MFGSDLVLENSADGTKDFVDSLLGASVGAATEAIAAASLERRTPPCFERGKSTARHTTATIATAERTNETNNRRGRLLEWDDTSASFPPRSIVRQSGSTFLDDKISTPTKWEQKACQRRKDRKVYHNNINRKVVGTNLSPNT